MSSSPGSLQPSGHEPLRRWERNALLAFLFVAYAFGGRVLFMSAYDEVRRTDASVYFRAAWALRTGEKIYEIPDDRGLHFAYPPVAAIAFVPFADAPENAPRDWMMPYPVTVVVWYLLGLAATFFAVHWFACALEENARDPALRSPPAGCRRWWYNRMLPILICVAPIGATLERGQVTPYLLLFVSRMFLATVRGQNFRSGLWLAAAICLKVIPGLLLVFFAVRRDWRALAGCIVGGAIGVVVIPTAVMGVNGAVEVHRQFIEGVIKPGLGAGGTSTLQDEMMSMRRPGSQSIKAVIHNYQFWDRETRPELPNAMTKFGHLVGAALLVGGLVLAFGWRRQHDAVGLLMFLGGLLTCMILISPESHTHYFCVPMPLMMALTFRSMEHRPLELAPSKSLFAAFIVISVAFWFVMIPIWEMRREAGVTFWASLILWTLALVRLRSERPVQELDREQPNEMARAA